MTDNFDPSSGTVTVRSDHTGGFDEAIFEQAATLHIETLDDTSVWLGINMADGTSWRMVISARGKLSFLLENEGNHQN